MGYTIAEKIIKEHLLSGEMTKGTPIGLKIDQTLTQDATGTMAYLQLEALDVDQVKTEKSVAYIDHNTLQSGFMNADDHKYIGSVAKKHGIYFSRPGNGICHQVQLCLLYTSHSRHHCWRNHVFAGNQFQVAAQTFELLLHCICNLWIGLFDT